MGYADLHTHTKNSDGIYEPDELIQRAKAAGITVLAMTDHNKLLDNLEELQKRHTQIRLIRGSEITALHEFSTGKKVEIHIVGLLMKDYNSIAGFLNTNFSDGKERMQRILQRLKNDCGIDIGSYEEIQKRFPGKRIGRMQLAKTMEALGVAETVTDAFDIYIGDYGKRLAWVENPVKFATIEQVVTAIKEAKGVAVLAHALSYQLENGELEELMEVFKNAGGHGMEVMYGRWDADTRNKAKEIAEHYGLYPSCASDFHGCFEDERLDHAFDETYFKDIEMLHGRLYDE